MPKGSGWFLASGLCPRVSAGRRVSASNVLMAGLVGGIWTPKPRVGLVASSGVIRRPTLAITFTGRLPLHPEDPARGLAGTWLRSMCEATCVECPTAAVTNGHERSGFRQHAFVATVRAAESQVPGCVPPGSARRRLRPLTPASGGWQHSLAPGQLTPTSPSLAPTPLLSSDKDPWGDTGPTQIIPDDPAASGSRTEPPLQSPLCHAR